MWSNHLAVASELKLTGSYSSHCWLWATEMAVGWDQRMGRLDLCFYFFMDWVGSSFLPRDAYAVYA